MSASDDDSVPFEPERPKGRRSKPRLAAVDGDLVLDREAPLAIARDFLERRYQAGGYRTLHHYAGEFNAWDGAGWLSREEASLRAEIYADLEAAKVETSKGLADFRPDSRIVSAILDALRAATFLPADTPTPSWTEYAADCCPPAAEIAPVRNGLLHLPQMELLPATPTFWCQAPLAAPWLPDGPPPASFLQFLSELWPADQQSIDCLQEIFGLMLTPDTKHQKIFLLCGPRRSGKGTIVRVLTALFGAGNVAAPTLASLGTQFGLAPLIGKTVAVIADARLGGKTDQQAIAERMLSISGEDALTVDRKYTAAWTGRLPVRFIVATNELPRIADASGALASRFLVLKLERSFLGFEDTGLTSRLLEELPGILRWAVDGWRRLQDRGRFLQPDSAADAAATIEELGAPISAFIAEECTTGPGCEVVAAHLFERWRAWCERQGRVRPGSAQSFGRDLRAALPGVRIIQRRVGGDVLRCYCGVSAK